MTTLGIIVGTRGFFPSSLCEGGRNGILAALEKQGIKPIILPIDATPKFGAVESLKEARACADLFIQHKDEIDGVIVTLPNFGDERAVANTLRWADLNVPVLIHAWNDDNAQLDIQHRRDSFCGKMSCCNNLRQYGIDYTLTTLHTDSADSETFTRDLQQFVATCKVVKAFKNLRVGALGARPAPFTTVRYSEKLLEASGISVETLDLSELIGWTGRMKDNDSDVQDKLAKLNAYTNVSNVPAASLLKMAKLGVGMDRWIKDQQLGGLCIQCWTSMEEFYGVVPCSLMSMLSESLIPAACETDICGLLGMIALQAASGTPSALLDWNNNFGKDPNKGILFHCSNLPKSFFCQNKMDYQAIIAGSVGKENAYGTICGQIAPGPFTFTRVSTDDQFGEITAYVGEGKFTDDKLDTFGGYGIFEIPELQTLLRYICENGFEHHVAASRSQVAGAIAEAFENYLGWDVYRHS